MLLDAVANDPNTSIAALFSVHTPTRIQLYRANREGVPPILLALLANDDDALCRSRRAADPLTPPHALAILADDPDLGVRYFLSANPNTPSNVLKC